MISRFDVAAVCDRRAWLILALALLATTLAAPAAADFAPNLTTTATWQDNVTNADRRSDILDAFALDADLSASHRIGLTSRDALLLSAHAAAESFPRFTSLAHATLGPSLTLQRKLGLGPAAPTIGVAFAVDARLARDPARSGLAAALTLTWRQRLGDDTLLRLAQTFTRLDARSAVYDRSAAETALDLTRTLDERWQFSALARLRFGDVLSHGTPPRPDLVALARVRTPVDTFGRPMVAYSFSATTLSGGLSLTRVLDDRTSFTLAAEYRTTEKSTLRYLNRLVSASLAHQF